MEADWHFIEQVRNREFLWSIKSSLYFKEALNMLCRQTFQIAPRSQLKRIDELFLFSTQFHLMKTLQVAHWSTHSIFHSTTEMY